DRVRWADYGDDAELLRAPGQEVAATDVGGRLEEHVVGVLRTGLGGNDLLVCCGQVHLRGVLAPRNLGANRAAHAVRNFVPPDHRYACVQEVTNHQQPP